MSALRVQGLVKSYPGRGWSSPRQLAVKGVDLQVQRGEVVGLIGESGSGKTTLVRAALGLLPFDEGRVELLGRELKSLSAAELRGLRQNAQLVFQNPDSMLNPGLTVREHLLESALLHRPDSNPDDLVARTIRQVGLEQRIDALPRHLSGGEKRRAGVARVLIADPVLVVADEPTAGLDAALKGSLIDLLLAGRGPDRATLLVSHDLPLMAYACDRLAVMREGQVVDRLRVDELGSRQHHPYTESLLMNAGMRRAQGATG